MLYIFAESALSKPMPPWAIGALVAGTGLIPVAASVLNWKPFLNVPQFRVLRNGLGEERARVAIGIGGGLMIAFGALIATGVLKKGFLS
jgi:hypothetical protein